MFSRQVITQLSNIWRKPKNKENENVEIIQDSDLQPYKRGQKTRYPFFDTEEIWKLLIITLIIIIVFNSYSSASKNNASIYKL